MKEIENQCVGCPKEIGCLGSGCPNRNIIVYYCDRCNGYANYKIGDEDMCEECAEKYCNELWEQISLEDKCELLDLYFERI